MHSAGAVSQSQGCMHGQAAALHGVYRYVAVELHCTHGPCTYNPHHASVGHSVKVITATGWFALGTRDATPATVLGFGRLVCHQGQAQGCWLACAVAPGHNRRQALHSSCTAAHHALLTSTHLPEQQAALSPLQLAPHAAGTGTMSSRMVAPALQRPMAAAAAEVSQQRERAETGPILEGAGALHAR